MSEVQLSDDDSTHSSPLSRINDAIANQNQHNSIKSTSLLVRIHEIICLPKQFLHDIIGLNMIP